MYKITQICYYLGDSRSYLAHCRILNMNPIMCKSVPGLPMKDDLGTLSLNLGAKKE